MVLVLIGVAEGFTHDVVLYGRFATGVVVGFAVDMEVRLEVVLWVTAVLQVLRSVLSVGFKQV